MKNNKGYTLVELIVSIAIFSVVSVAIFSIMSSSLSAYKRSMFEVDVQENAQIVGNQLEELLCDAKELKGITSDGVNTSSCSFVSEGKDYEITYSGNTIKVNNVAIASDVNKFYISGWKSGDDNKIAVDLSFNNQEGKNYSYNREIYLRNCVEYSEFQNIKNNMSSTSSTTPGGDVISVKFYRYDEIDLTNSYGIRYIEAGSVLKGGFVGGTEASPSYSKDNSYFSLDISDNGLSSDTDDKRIVLKGKAALNNSFSGPLASSTVKFIGYKDASCSEKVELAISCDDVAIVSNNCVYQHQYKSTTNEGLHTPVTVKGIDINKALASGSFSYTYTPHLTNGTASYSGTSTTVSSAFDAIDKGTNKIGEIPYGNKEVLLGIYANPYEPGLIISSSNDSIKSKCDGFQGNEDSFQLQFDFEMNNNGTTLDCSDKMIFKFDILGSGF